MDLTRNDISPKKENKLEFMYCVLFLQRLAFNGKE